MARRRRGPAHRAARSTLGCGHGYVLHVGRTGLWSPERQNGCCVRVGGHQVARSLQVLEIRSMLSMTGPLRPEPARDAPRACGGRPGTDNKR